MNSKGFTLIEVILALAILSIIVIPFTQLFMTSTEVNNMSKREVQALYLAQKKMEEIKNSFDEEFNGAVQIDPENDPDFEYDINTDFEVFKKVFPGDTEGEFKRFDTIAFFEKIDTKIGDYIDTGSFEEKEEDFRINLHKDGENNTIFRLWNQEYDENDPQHSFSTQSDTVEIIIEKLGDFQYKVKPLSSIYSTFKNDGEGYIVFKAVTTGDDLSERTLKINNESDKTVLLYKYDDFKECLNIKVAEGADKGKVMIYDNIIQNAGEKTYAEALYKITVIVKYNNRKYSELVSLIRK